MADPPLLAAAPGGDSHSDIPLTTQTENIPFNISSHPPRTIPHRSPFFGVFRTAYEKADASSITESLLSWPEKYSHSEPPAILFGPPGTAGTSFTSLRHLDHDTARRVEIVRRGARAAGWDVFFASVRAVWSGPSTSELFANTQNWPDYDAESALFEHLRRRDLTRSFFDVEALSVHDLDGEPIVPLWISNSNSSRLSILHKAQGLIHDELFCSRPHEERYPGLQRPDHGWTRQFWHADTILLVPQAQSPSVLSSSVAANFGDDQVRHIAKYLLGLALQDTTGFPDSNITVHNAYIAVDMLYRVMRTALLGQVAAGAVMTPSVKSQILMFAGEQRDYALFLQACTLQSRFDTAPDQQLFVPWLDCLVKRRPLMNFWEPHLQECLTQAILSYQNLHDRVEFALALPNHITGQGSLPHLLVSSWLKPLLIPDDLRTPLLCSPKDGRALAKAALSFGNASTVSTVATQLITDILVQMQLPAEPMPWIAGFIEALHLKIDWGMTRLLCQTFLKFDHFFTTHHIPRFVSAWRSVDIDLVGFLLFLARQVDIKLYKLWLADLSRSVKQWEDFHSPGMRSFFSSVYIQVSKVSLLDSLCTDLLKQNYRMFVRPLQAHLYCHRDLSRKPSKPVDPNDPIAMEGYRFLVDASQQTARFRWTALQRDLTKWLWKDTGVLISLDTSTQPPTLVVKKLSMSSDEWFKQRKVAAQSCKELEDIRHASLQHFPNSQPQRLVDWSFADGTGPDPAWVMEDDPAIPPPETLNTPSRRILDRVVSPGSSPTFASPTSSDANSRDESIRDETYGVPLDEKPDDKPAPDPMELTKEEAFKTLSYKEFMLRRHRLELKDEWEKICEEDKEDFEELYLLLGRRKGLPHKAYITEEVLQLAQNPAEGLVTNHRRRWLATHWISRLWEHRKGIRLITPADDPVFKHSKYEIKRKRGMGGDDDSEDEDDDHLVW
ncbi:hypothetical protein QBC45DRAFT_81221 [Copromyces sp. CBS 386.78]|nr:hypothetical protein QBC45DRAFT_81221 [Copromyces sp. CBS 386.78]